MSSVQDRTAASGLPSSKLLSMAIKSPTCKGSRHVRIARTCRAAAIAGRHSAALAPGRGIEPRAGEPFRRRWLGRIGGTSTVFSRERHGDQRREKGPKGGKYWDGRGVGSLSAVSRCRCATCCKIAFPPLWQGDRAWRAPRANLITRGDRVSRPLVRRAGVEPAARGREASRPPGAAYRGGLSRPWIGFA